MEPPVTGNGALDAGGGMTGEEGVRSPLDGAGDAAAEAPTPAVAEARSIDAEAAEPVLMLRAGAMEAPVNNHIARRLTTHQVDGVRWLYGAFHGTHRAGNFAAWEILFWGV